MSRLSAAFPRIIAGERGSIDRDNLGTLVAKSAIALRGLLSRLIALALDYSESMHELESLDEQDLRDLKFSRGDFREIAWAEAWRRYRGHEH
jgi:hypothetical protein